MKETTQPPSKEGKNYCRHCKKETYHTWQKFTRGLLTCHKCYNMWNVHGEYMVDRNFNMVPGTGLSSKEKKALKKGSGGRVVR